ncbi:hypothetical protein QQF64_001398 [Cirrhinus molitorella]|uniref:Uncharacterized protein n=1 Tax=Cirrhinus molitorella TaxID=172907 RepID=A0ABR3P1E6_9TELE
MSMYRTHSLSGPSTGCPVATRMRERNAALTERNTTVTQQKEQPFSVYNLHAVFSVSYTRLFRGMEWFETNVRGFPWSISVRLVMGEEIASGGAA